MRPYEAASFDKMHSNDHGMFGEHLWKEFKEVIKSGTRSCRADIDDAYD